MMRMKEREMSSEVGHVGQFSPSNHSSVGHRGGRLSFCLHRYRCALARKFDESPVLGLKGVSAWWRSIWQRASASNRSKLKMSAAANSAVRVTSDPLPVPRARPRARASSPRLEIKSSLPRQRTEPIPLPLLAKSYWRIAGMSYLKYSSMCAEVVRGCLKEPFLTKVSHHFPVSALATPRGPSDYSLACAVTPVKSTRADLETLVSRVHRRSPARLCTSSRSSGPTASPGSPVSSEPDLSHGAPLG